MKVTVNPDPFLVYQPKIDQYTARDKAGFCNYVSGLLLDHVFTTYRLMHVHQMVDFIRSKQAWFGDFSYKKMMVIVAVGLLHWLVDESDPDVDFSHSFQAFQMGHDEYLYQMMVFNKFSLPLEASYKIRFHSFCPWHMGSDYQQWCSNQDLAMPEFNLTKCPGLPDEKLRPYYQGLLDKYCPGILSR
ncbi:hypothetical protein P7K49_026978 [Saguinus oedipus]|uniref:Inositol oxygenase n=1 Tax=Saguinus oedipus TaxID=9490 RepID=A0ABQ9UEQ6_SAGOE|nr:hypothetical protein P7K49_026978 [Saguinus oedipus]